MSCGGWKILNSGQGKERKKNKNVKVPNISEAPNTSLSKPTLNESLTELEGRK